MLIPVARWHLIDADNQLAGARNPSILAVAARVRAHNYALLKFIAPLIPPRLKNYPPRT